MGSGGTEAMDYVAWLNLRGGELNRDDVITVSLNLVTMPDLLVALDEALVRLRELDERQARVVECRFFGGMTEEETAEAIGIGLRTAKRDWAKAKGWLYRERREDSRG